MDQAGDAGRGAGLGDGAGAIRLYGRKALAALLLHDADEIDDGVRALHRSGDRSGVAQIGLHRVDLADGADRLEEIGKVRPAHGDAHPVATLDERTHDMAADETGAAEDRDELLGRGLGSHRESSV